MGEKFLKYHTDTIAHSKRVMKSILRNEKQEPLVQIFLAETLGCTFLMYFGCMGLFGSVAQYVPLPPLQGGISFGFVVASIIVAFGHISNAHLNPSVTLCALILRTITPTAALVYLVAEIVGCIFGLWFLTITTPQALYETYINNSAPCGFCNTVVAPNVSVTQAFLIEFTATAFLMFVVCSCWDPKNAKSGDSGPIKFGLLITVLSIVAGPFTGTSMNPARTLAPAIINNVWTDHWIYWAGPLSGSAAATLLYKFVFLESDEVSEEITANVAIISQNPSKEKSINEKERSAV